MFLQEFFVRAEQVTGYIDPDIIDVLCIAKAYSIAAFHGIPDSGKLVELIETAIRELTAKSDIGVIKRIYGNIDLKIFKLNPVHAFAIADIYAILHRRDPVDFSAIPVHKTAAIRQTTETIADASDSSDTEVVSRPKSAFDRVEAFLLGQLKKHPSGKSLSKLDFDVEPVDKKPKSYAFSCPFPSCENRYTAFVDKRHVGSTGFLRHLDHHHKAPKSKAAAKKSTVTTRTTLTVNPKILSLIGYGSNYDGEVAWSVNGQEQLFFRTDASKSGYYEMVPCCIDELRKLGFVKGDEIPDATTIQV